jgi:hypothetical protein
MAGAALVSATGATLSLALFTDSTTRAASFTTGTIHIGVTPVATIFSSGTLMPGDVITQAVDVENTGTAQMRYAISANATDADGKDLTGSITVEIQPVNTSCAAFDGTDFWNAPIPVAETALLGNYLNHPNGGHTLAAGAFDHLCFRATFPKSITDPNLEGAHTDMTFTFYAEQTANNP